MDVLEEEDERLHVGEPAHDLTRRPRDLRWAALTLDRLQQPRGQADQVGDGIVLTARPQLLERLLERLVVGDARRGLDHLGERPVRHAFAIRQAATLEHARALRGVDELADEAALADAGLSVDREEMRAAVAHRSLVRVLEQLQLGFAADERGVDVHVRPVDGADHAPGAHRRAHPLQLERPRVLDYEPASCKAVGGRADEDLARHRGLLETGREIDCLAGGERRVRLVDDDLAGLDADADLEIQLANRLANPERRPGSAFGVVLVCLRDAERREHGVAGELLDDAAVHRHAVGDAVEELGHPPADDLRICARDELRRIDDVDEQHRCQLALYVASHHVIVRTPSRAMGFRHSISPVLNPAVFKAYDVRGIYPDDLDEEGAYAIGRAYVEHFEPRRIAVGRDMRLSAPAMARAAMEGAADAGADVVDIGMVGTEMLYCAVGELGLEGGIAVTASHNPKQYTGMKIVRRGALPVGGDSGLFDIRDRALADFWTRLRVRPWSDP